MTTISKIEEKLMTIQTLGKLLEASTVFANVGIDGILKCPPYQKPILDSSDRLKIQVKIVEFVESIKPDKSSVKMYDLASEEGQKAFDTLKKYDELINSETTNGVNGTL